MKPKRREANPKLREKDRRLGEDQKLWKKLNALYDGVVAGRYQDHADHEEVRAWLKANPDGPFPEHLNRDGYWTLLRREYYPQLRYGEGN